jgi:C4-dicarboxylate-specific signal transduction histidine kinase
MTAMVQDGSGAPFSSGSDAWGEARIEGHGGLTLLTASIVHEVSQPLSGITTNASTCLRMLCTDPPNIEGARATARRTLRDVERAAAVISRLRALFTPSPHGAEPVDLNTLVREALESFRDDLKRARVRVRRCLAPDVPPVAGDRIQLQQVILNLVRNAVEAMAGEVACGGRRITIVTQLHANAHALLSVHDVGAGIARHALEEIFRPFNSTKPHGMGIGLSISRAIAERHGGRLWATLNDGPGATFWLSIPCAAEEPCPARPAAETHALGLPGAPAAGDA